MTTPAYVNSPFRVLQHAYRNAGYLERGQDPDSEMLADGMVRLNDLLNLWQTQGLKLWLQLDLAVTLTAGQQLYTFGPTGTVVMTRPTRVLEGYYRDLNNNDRPLLMISRNEWDTLSVKTTVVGQQGSVNSFFVDKQVSTMNVYFWLCPDATAATGKAHLLLQQQQPNVVGLTDTMNFGPEWFIALAWGLAAEIATGQPQSVIDRCMTMADSYRSALENWDVEDASTTFQPDARTQYVGNRFT
jgi:hypothetical protein